MTYRITLSGDVCLGTCICVLGASEGKGGHQIWNWSHKWLWATVWVAAGPLNSGPVDEEVLLPTQSFLWHPDRITYFLQAVCIVLVFCIDCTVFLHLREQSLQSSTIGMNWPVFKPARKGGFNFETNNAVHTSDRQQTTRPKSCVVRANGDVQHRSKANGLTQSRVWTAVHKCSIDSTAHSEWIFSSQKCVSYCYSSKHIWTIEFCLRLS